MWQILISFYMIYDVPLCQIGFLTMVSLNFTTQIKLNRFYAQNYEYDRVPIGISYLYITKVIKLWPVFLTNLTLNLKCLHGQLKMQSREIKLGTDDTTHLNQKCPVHNIFPKFIFHLCIWSNFIWLLII